MRLDSVGKRLIAALASGVMLYFVVGLEPRWFIAWVAPIPLLLAAFQASAAETWFTVHRRGRSRLCRKF